MITEHGLSRGHQSFWKKTFPLMSRVVRKLNLEKKYYVEAIEFSSAPDRRALVNETGFRLFEYVINNGLNNSDDVSHDKLQEIQDKSIKYISRFQRLSQPSVDRKFTDIEFVESLHISNRLHEYFRDKTNISISPYFRGCGILNSCYGDILCNEVLYEVKAGAREFRVNDVRQLLTYCTLANLEKKISIKKISLINPRNGFFAIIPVKDVVDISCGMSLQEAFSSIVDYLDDPGDFR